MQSETRRERGRSCKHSYWWQHLNLESPPAWWRNHPCGTPLSCLGWIRGWSLAWKRWLRNRRYGIPRRCWRWWNRRGMQSETTRTRDRGRSCKCSCCWRHSSWGSPRTWWRSHRRGTGQTCSHWKSLPGTRSGKCRWTWGTSASSCGSS